MLCMLCGEVPTACGSNGSGATQHAMPCLGCWDAVQHDGQQDRIITISSSIMSELRPLWIPVAGLTIWLPVFVAGLVASPSPDAAPLRAHDTGASSSSGSSSGSKLLLVEESAIVLWSMVGMAWKKYSSRIPLDPSVWLHLPMIQLADRVLANPTMAGRFDVLYSPLATAMADGVATGYTHPRVAAAAGRRPDEALGARVADAVNQVGLLSLVVTVSLYAHHGQHDANHCRLISSPWDLLHCACAPGHMGCPATAVPMQGYSSTFDPPVLNYLASCC
jgi:hypothetical protein